VVKNEIHHQPESKQCCSGPSVTMQGLPALVYRIVAPVGESGTKDQSIAAGVLRLRKKTHEVWRRKPKPAHCVQGWL